MELSEVVKRSQLHIAIIKFFYENPAAVDSLSGISTWVRGEKAKVKDALEDLVECGVLTAHKVPSTTGYSITQDAKVFNKLKKVLKEQNKKCL